MNTGVAAGRGDESGSRKRRGTGRDEWKASETTLLDGSVRTTCGM